MNNALLEWSASFIDAITLLGYWCMTKLYFTNNSEKFIEFLGKFVGFELIAKLIWKDCVNT